MVILSWKFPPHPHSMLEIPMPSMETNFYPNIEVGGRDNFFPTFETKVVAADYSIIMSRTLESQAIMSCMSYGNFLFGISFFIMEILFYVFVLCK